MRRQTIFLFSFLLIILFAGPTFADELVAVSGKVTVGAEKKPVAGVKVDVV